MELNFMLLVLAALVGLIVRACTGYNPWTMAGAFGLLVLFLPMIQLAFVDDPATMQVMADGYTERLINAIPSIIVGEVAGYVAAMIFQVFAGVFGMFR